MLWTESGTARVPRRLASKVGRHMRELADATRELAKQHARKHLSRTGRRVLCAHCRNATRAAYRVEQHLAGDYFA